MSRNSSAIMVSWACIASRFSDCRSWGVPIFPTVACSADPIRSIRNVFRDDNLFSYISIHEPGPVTRLCPRGPDVVEPTMNWLTRSVSVTRGLVAVDVQCFADGGNTCSGVQATPCDLSAVEEGAVVDSMGGIGAICAMGCVSTSVLSLAERAEAGTAIATKMAKMGGLIICGRLALGRLSNDKRDVTSSRSESISSFMKDTRDDEGQF